MNKIIKRLHVLFLCLEVLCMILVWFESNISTLKIGCFCWIICSFMNDLSEVIKHE
ncbi:hypothetical protein ACOT7R_08855 [Clostridium perfringens]|uniref:hypothetical protein n=1 Tax=Clostridium perfringens TaxID=1502 RepID=UPI003BA97CFC